VFFSAVVSSAFFRGSWSLSPCVVGQQKNTRRFAQQKKQKKRRQGSLSRVVVAFSFKAKKNSRTLYYSFARIAREYDSLFFVFFSHDGRRRIRRRIRRRPVFAPIVKRRTPKQRDNFSRVRPAEQAVYFFREHGRRVDYVLARRRRKFRRRRTRSLCFTKE
jgi:hypothetical protein